jgi:two-component system, OmpR family, phosphate regulon sensor histidine kinase PhoR
MTKPIKKIGLFLILIIALPILFLAIREIASLNENERVIGEIYKNQIESILFSVNQYSEDIVRSWGMRLEGMTGRDLRSNVDLEKKLTRLFSDNHSLKYICISDSTLTNNFLIDRKEIQKNYPTTLVLVRENRQLINRLYRYKENGFTKFEPVSLSAEKNTQFLIFILDNKQICIFSLDRQKFVEQNLSAKILSVARGEFVIAVIDSVDNRNIYSTDSVANPNFERRKNLWLLPDYSLGIILKGQTVESLVRERSNLNLYLILGLSVLMLLVAFWGYRNIKHEVELAQIKSDFVSNVSHELRTPLALINMFAETLTMGRVNSEEKKNEYYNIIQSETERLSKIVNKILSFSKIEAGKWKYNFAKTDTNLLAEKIYNSYKYHLENNGFEFIFNPSAESITAKIDSEAVSEAVINLIDNSIKYSGKIKKVVLRTGCTGNSVFIEVEDSGLGISKEEQNKIFDKFYRSSKGDIHNTKGTGLGLTMVKYIIDAHKGEVKLSSEPEKGSRFSLFFPVNNND